MRRVVWFALALLAPSLSGSPATAADERPPFRVALIGPLSGTLARCGAEALDGAKAAAAWKSTTGGVGGRPIEVLPFDDKDEPASAEKAYAAALAAKADVIVAASSSRTVDALAAKARAKGGKLPAIFVGFAGPKPTVDPHDPVLFIGSWPVDQAIRAADALVLPCRSKEPALIVEASSRGEELEGAFVRNVGAGRHFVGVARVAPGAAVPPDVLAGWKAKGCDRLVVAGEPDLFDAVVTARAALAWDVALLGGESTLSSAASSIGDGRVLPPPPVTTGAPAAGPSVASSFATCFLVGSPQRTMSGAPRMLYDTIEKQTKAGENVVVYPRSIAAFTAVELLADSAQPTGPKPAKSAEVIAALRDVRYGDDETKTPFFDLMGRAALYHFTVWRAAAKGPEPVESGYLPAEGFGPMMALRRPSMYRAEPGTKVVWLTYGDKNSKPPRTIEKDMAELGLATRGYEGSLDQFFLDELMARAIGKLYRLFLRNEDGTAIPGCSFDISLTAEKPTDLKPNDYWTMVLAGDDQDAGGRAFPGESRCEIYATFLRRTLFQSGAITPRVDHDDLAWVNGTYLWRGIKSEQLRADQLRCLCDGYAGGFALTGSHELGHLAGLSHDTADPRSIMNVTEGQGLRETAAFFIPTHAAILERLLGRAKEPKEPRR
jgi:ABC-type branched-subunit amino acid transport system substrate-binding protein